MFMSDWQGGLKAVVWTDSVQTGVMFIGVILVAAAGTIAVGGVKTVFTIAAESGRANLDKSVTLMLWILSTSAPRQCQ